MKYLVVHPDGYDNDFIRDLVRIKQLDFIGMRYLDRLRDSCVVPRPFYPEDPLHHRSQRFLRKERILGLFQPSKDVQMAGEILDLARAKERVESMLISNSDPAWICVGLRRIGVDVTPEAVVYFKQFYFNIDLLDSSELRAVLRARAYYEGSQDPDESALSSIMLKQSKQDPRELAAGTQISALAGMMNSLRMGILPSNVDISRLVTAARIAGVANLVESLHLKQSERSRDFALVVKVLTEVIEHVGEADDELEKGLQRLVLATESRDVPHINQLSAGGSYTMDVLPAGEEETHVERTSGEPQ